MSEFIQIGNFTLGGIVGLLLGAFLGHALALRRSKQNREMLKYNDSVIPMRESLINGISRVENGEVGFKVVKDLYPNQRKLVMSFEGAISRDKIEQFMGIWSEYESFYHDVCDRPVEDCFYPPEGESAFIEKRSTDVRESYFEKMLLSLPVDK